MGRYILFKINSTSKFNRTFLNAIGVTGALATGLVRFFLIGLSLDINLVLSPIFSNGNTRNIYLVDLSGFVFYAPSNNESSEQGKTPGDLLGEKQIPQTEQEIKDEVEKVKKEITEHQEDIKQASSEVEKLQKEYDKLNQKHSQAGDDSDYDLEDHLEEILTVAKGDLTASQNKLDTASEALTQAQHYLDILLNCS